MAIALRECELDGAKRRDRAEGKSRAGRDVIGLHQIARAVGDRAEIETCEQKAFRPRLILQAEHRSPEALARKLVQA